MKIELWELSAAALIVSSSGGFLYGNQVAGTSCQQRDFRGYLLPIDEDGFLQREFTAHFCGPKWKGECDDGIDESTASLLDELLMKRAPFVSVDRTRLDNCVEAWVHVTVDIEKCGLVDDGSSTRRAVLTWSNSD